MLDLSWIAAFFIVISILDLLLRVGGSIKGLSQNLRFEPPR